MHRLRYLHTKAQNHIRSRASTEQVGSIVWSSQRSIAGRCHFCDASAGSLIGSFMFLFS